MKTKTLILGIGCFVIMFMGISLSVYGQTVSGTVTNAQTGEPLVGVNILVKNTSTGTTTNKKGHYSLNAPSLQDTLVFSYIGFKKQMVAINGRSSINIQMKPRTVMGQQLVVTGYMKQKKVNLTGSITVVPTEALEKNYGSTNIMKSLQGVIPGLQVSTNGSPVGNVGLQIRGKSSFHGVHPLIVIDGVPSYSLNLRDINAGNIASMQILKGPAAAAIYGSQSAGGVILIQTKKGHAGKTQVTYHGTFGFSKVMDPPNMLNTRQYGRALWRASINSGQDPEDVTRIYNYKWHRNDKGYAILDKVTPVECLVHSSDGSCLMPSANTNWLKTILQAGIQQNHQINVSGGGENSKVFFSLNYYKNEGTQIHTHYKRYSLRLNSSFQALNDHLTIGENLEVSHLQMNDQNQMHQAIAEPAIVPVHSADGGWGGSAVGKGMGDYWNPVRILTLNKNNGKEYNKLIGNIYASLEFLNHFTLKSKLGLYWTRSYNRTIDFKFHEAGGKFQNYNAVEQSYWHQARLVLSNTLEYKTSLGKHNIDVLVGMEANKYKSQRFSAGRRDILFQNYDYAYLDRATGNKSVGGTGAVSRLLSLFSKVTYNYNSKYLFTATVRYDGSSKFGKHNQFGLFPAVSAGWRLSEEKFLEDNPAISNLKLRVGWGIMGNSQIPSTATMTYFLADYNLTAYAISGKETGNLPSGFYRAHVGNPSLHWEETREFNVGIDFGLFNQKITGSVNWYYKKTTGMLFNPPYLGALGEGAGMWINAADMTNQGIEVVLNYQGKISPDFSYSIRGNVAHNQNVVRDVPESVKYAYGGNGLDDSIIGHPLDSFYGFVVSGLFETMEEVKNSPKQAGKGLGRLRYKDLNGDGKIDWTNDRKWIGVSNPTISYGFSFNANYKNFNFSMAWQGLAGREVYNGWKTYSDFWNIWIQNGMNHPVRILNAWNPVNNRDSGIPALALSDTNDERRMSTYLIEPGGYLKLRNIELGYSLPADISSNIGVQKIHIYVMAKNLISFTNSEFTGLDPETPASAAYSSPYLRPQSFIMGIDIKF